MDDGHCGLPNAELVPLAVELLEISQELVQTALDLELSEGTVIAASVGETPCVFLTGLYRAEQVIAERLIPARIKTDSWGDSQRRRSVHQFLNWESDLGSWGWRRRSR